MKINKQDIFTIAARLFKEQGFNAVSMRDLADAVGIKAGSLYSHISSKQEILSQIIIDLAEHFTDGMNVVVKSKKDPVKKLEDVIALHVKISIEFSNEIGCLNVEWMNLKEPHLTNLVKMRANYEKNVKKIIKQGIKEKAFKDMNENIMLYSILSTLRSVYLWKDSIKLTEDKMVKQIKKSLLKGITR